MGERVSVETLREAAVREHRIALDLRAEGAPYEEEKFHLDNCVRLGQRADRAELEARRNG